VGQVALTDPDLEKKSEVTWLNYAPLVRPLSLSLRRLATHHSLDLSYHIFPQKSSLSWILDLKCLIAG
jgi:hypothetical protein